MADMMRFDIQRLRNLTTGRLHTKMEHIYEDLEAISGAGGLMTHMLPRVMDAVEPWLRRNVLDARFWDDAHDKTHIGTIEILAPTAKERNDFFERFRAFGWEKCDCDSTR